MADTTATAKTLHAAETIKAAHVPDHYGTVAMVLPVQSDIGDIDALHGRMQKLAEKLAAQHGADVTHALAGKSWEPSFAGDTPLLAVTEAINPYEGTKERQLVVVTAPRGLSDGMRRHLDGAGAGLSAGDFVASREHAAAVDLAQRNAQRLAAVAAQELGLSIDTTRDTRSTPDYEFADHPEMAAAPSLAVVITGASRVAGNKVVVHSNAVPVSSAIGEVPVFHAAMHAMHLVRPAANASHTRVFGSINANHPAVQRRSESQALHTADSHAVDSAARMAWAGKQPGLLNHAGLKLHDYFARDVALDGKRHAVVAGIISNTV